MNNLKPKTRKLKPGPRRRVVCIFCRAWLETLAEEYVLVLGTCRTCVYRIVAGAPGGV